MFICTAVKLTLTRTSCEGGIKSAARQATQFHSSGEPAKERKENNLSDKQCASVCVCVCVCVWSENDGKEIRQGSITISTRAVGKVISIDVM